MTTDIDLNANLTDPTALDLDAIRRLARRATGGPWTLLERQDGDRRVLTVVAEGHGDEHDNALVAEVPMSPGDDEVAWRGDAELIAAARTVVPAMAAEIRRLRAEWDRLVNERSAMLPVINAAQAWAEAHEESDHEATIRATADLYGTVEQYRVMDLALTNARTEQPEATR